ncbi:MAG: transposase [Treponema sp.]|nr:transposase [Treponema sp.]
MKTITEIIGGGQALLNMNYSLQGCFEEYLSDEYKMFLLILRAAEEYLPPYIRPKKNTGRPPYPYFPFIRSMLGKSFFSIEKTSNFIQRLKGDPNLRLLCGFTKVPDAATFSRMFAYLAQEGLWDPSLDKLVKEAHKGKVVYHVCCDSMMIAAREKVSEKKEKKVEKPKKKRGRPRKNTIKPPKEASELEKQITEDAATALDTINKNCAWGCKKNSQGKVETTKGYKLHLDVDDIGFPLTGVVTGANVHDSQLAIIMEKMTEKKVTFCYSLMDSAFDSKTISDFIYSRERVPIIDPNKRNNKDRPPLDPAKQERYKIRTTVERSNSHLRDNLIPKSIYVKGYTKVSFVLMASVFCLAVIKYLQYFAC